MPSPQARILVHAGMAKTGSSAVQKFLRHHREELEQLGVSYPEHGIDANGVSSGNREALLEQGPDGHFVAAADRVAATLAQFESSGLRQLLLSSEFFGPALPQLVPMLPADTRYVFYVRDPLGLFESHYNQMVKRNGHTERFHLHRPAPGEGIAGLDVLLRAIPGDPDMVLRPYHSALFEGGNIVTDLLRAGGMPEPAAAAAGPERVNLAYTLAALEFKRTANHLPLGGLANRLDRVLQGCPVGERDYSLLSPAEYAELRSWSLDELGRLIDGLGYTSLEPLRSVLPGTPQRPHRTQEATLEELAAVSSHVRSAAPKVHARLVELVETNPDVELPYPGFRDILGSPHAPKPVVAQSRLGRLAARWRR